MAAVSLTTLRARARERADFTGSAFIADDSTGLDALLNEGAQRLHALLAEKFGANYTVSSAAIATVAGTTSYNLPTDFFKLLGMDLTVNGVTTDLDPFSFKERNTYKAALPAEYTMSLPRYALVGSTYWLYPAPNAVYSGTLWYVPQLQVTPASGPVTNILATATDTINFPNGWETFIVLYAAKAMLDKEESNSDAVTRELQRLEFTIEKEAEERDAANPHQVVDLDRSYDDPRWVI